MRYKNIRYGNEVEVTAEEYENQLADPSVFENKFFDPFKDYVEGFEKMDFTNGTKLYTIKYKRIAKPVCILWGPLKNSGTMGKDNKRIQVLPNIELKDGLPYFAIGAYNTLDSNLYAVILGGVREFIKNAQKVTPFSSLWVNYPNLWDAYKKNAYSWTDGAGREVLCVKDLEIEQIHRAIIQLLSGKKNSGTGENQPIVDYKEFTLDLNQYTDETLPRNPDFKTLALQRENYTCEICGTNHTFLDKNNKEYFEGHHLIMYNVKVQKRFKHSLDHPDNIICLCPNCHSEIHHGANDRKKKLILKLFTKHNHLMRNYGIYSISDFNEIIADYINE